MHEFTFRLATSQAGLSTAPVLTLSDMSISTSQTLYIDRDERDNLYIRVGSASAMSKRTPSSPDDLIAIPASTNTYMQWSADVAHNSTLKVRGRWL